MPALLAGALVFGTSAAVLVLEIIAGRLLAPHVGVTLETYTGIIGTVLAGIALGTWLGGRAADQTDPRRLPGPLLIVGGALALLTIPLIEGLAGLRLRADPAGIVLYAAVAVLPPAAVLSAVSPAVVKLQLRDLGETGSVVGRLSALGTAGAIVGTFLTGFVLVAAVPSRPIVLALGIGLIVAGVAVALTVGRQRGVLLPVAAAGALVLGTGMTLAAPEPCERESAYFCVRVEPDPDRATGRSLYLDTLRHGYVDLADPTWLEVGYIRSFGDVIDALPPAGGPIAALHLGGGAFTMPRYILATRPGSENLVLELDPLVVQTAREELGLETGSGLEVQVGDARLGVAGAADDRYDLVIGDAFGGLAVPWHLATRELLEEVRRVLTPEGVLVMNVIDHPPLAFARAELATLREVFPHVAVLAPASRIAGETGGNVVLLASDAPLPAEAIRAAAARRGDDVELVVEPAAIDAFIGDAIVLTDDFAPVDQLLTAH
jgi:MFS family permease